MVYWWIEQGEDWAMEDFRADRRRVMGGAVILAGAGLAAACSSGAKGSGTSAAAWEPTDENIDSWLDKPGTRHRMVFDSLTGEGGAEALDFANNFIHVNESDYALKPEQLGVVVIFRHMATPYGYNQAVWAKYGKGLAEKMKLTGDSAKRAATTNPLLAAAPMLESPPKGMEWINQNSLSDLSGKGVRFAVCGLATKAIAGMVAGKTGNADAIEAEFKSNLVPGALIVPAGISALNRAQEHGYTLAYIG
jgi:intracellular sulfur oxidation DsrE/DsrF family protein